jgi:hypothetical protein
VPTASQNRADVQEIWLKKADVEPPGTGKCCRAQALPFQLSARVIPAEPTEYPPTASQKVPVGQDTPNNCGELAGTVFLGSFGVGCARQKVPFHLSARVTFSPLVPRLVPTAVHASAAEQETDPSSPPGTVALGGFWICQS